MAVFLVDLNLHDLQWMCYYLYMFYSISSSQKVKYDPC